MRMFGSHVQMLDELVQLALISLRFANDAAVVRILHETCDPEVVRFVHCPGAGLALEEGRVSYLPFGAAHRKFTPCTTPSTLYEISFFRQYGVWWNRSNWLTRFDIMIALVENSLICSPRDL